MTDPKALTEKVVQIICDYLTEREGEYTHVASSSVVKEIESLLREAISEACAEWVDKYAEAMRQRDCAVAQAAADHAKKPAS